MRAAGFTLLEVLVAAAVMGIAMAAVGSTMAAAASARSVLAEQPLAYMLAREVRELADSLPRTSSGVVGVDSPAGALALDSLHGAVFSPPARADGSTDASLAGWSQHVSLAVCDLDAPGTVTADDPRLALSTTARRLYRVTVAVVHGDAVAGRFHWWLAP